jgi:hypothetical protein
LNAFDVAIAFGELLEESCINSWCEVSHVGLGRYHRFVSGCGLRRAFGGLG